MRGQGEDKKGDIDGEKVDISAVLKIHRQVNNGFNDRLMPILKGTNTDFRPLELGSPSPLLLDCGFPDLPIQVSVQRLVDKKLQVSHPFKISSIVNMPDCLRDPIAVFQSKTNTNSKVILTEMEENGVNFVVAVELNKFCGRINANSVRSLYPKDNIKDILLWHSVYNLAEHVNKEKFLNWLGKQQSNSADVTQLIKDTTKLLK